MHLSQILVYPIKSLDGVSVTEASVTSGGILEFDRIYAIVDATGAYVNAKRTAQTQLLRTTFDPSFRELSIWQEGDSARYQFSFENPDPLNQWLSDFFGFNVQLISEAQRGFPDDEKASGPTIVSESSLCAVTEWFPEIDLINARRRFRTNLEIAQVPAFWEDHLFGAADELKPFQVGDVHFLGHNPCQRCAVPTRDPDRGDVLPNFQKRFMELRRKNLPIWANKARFNHFYRFAINTSVPPSESGKILRQGDLIQVDL